MVFNFFPTHLQTFNFFHVPPCLQRSALPTEERDVYEELLTQQEIQSIIDLVNSMYDISGIVDVFGSLSSGQGISLCQCSYLIICYVLLNNPLPDHVSEKWRSSPDLAQMGSVKP